MTPEFSKFSISSNKKNQFITKHEFKVPCRSLVIVEASLFPHLSLTLIYVISIFHLCSYLRLLSGANGIAITFIDFGYSNIAIELLYTVYPKKYAHGFCFAVLCCGYTLTDFPISITLTSLALWQSNDCPSAIKATLMNMDKYFIWIHYERLHNHNKAKHNKTVCIFLGIYCTSLICKSTLGYVIACRLFGTKPFNNKPMTIM